MTQVLWTRTGYMADIVPRGKRNAVRTALVEVVPVEVPVVGPMVLAVSVEDKPVLFVHDGLFYEDICAVGDYASSCTDIAALRRDEIRHDLLRLGAGTTDLLALQNAEQILAKSIDPHGRDEGLDWASKKTSRLVVSDGRVMRRPEGPPCHIVSIYHPKSFDIKDFDNSDPAVRIEDGDRLFRSVYHEGHRAFLDRHAKGARGGYGRRRNLDWTDEGLAAEDIAALWVIWRTCDLSRRPLYSRRKDNPYKPEPADPMELDGDVVDILIDLRHLLLPYRDIAVEAGLAGSLARTAIGKLEDIAYLLRHDSREPSRKLAGNITEVLVEVEAMPPKPARDADIEALADVDMGAPAP